MIKNLNERLLLKRGGSGPASTNINDIEAFWQPQ